MNRALWIVASLLVVAGCGGKGGRRTYPLTTLTRLIEVGDSHVYNVTGELIPTSGSSTFLHGTLTVSVASEVLGGTTLTVISYAVNLTKNTGGGAIVENMKRYIAQDPGTREIVFIADNGGPSGATRVITNPDTDLPGTWSSSVGISRVIGFVGGDTLQTTFNVTGTELVESPFGFFLSWRASTTSKDSEHDENATEWWYPGLGVPVRVASRTADANGNVLALNAILGRTNVPLSLP